jgi:hypothetical protein
MNHFWVLGEMFRTALFTKTNFISIIVSPTEMDQKKISSCEHVSTGIKNLKHFVPNFANQSNAKSATAYQRSSSLKITPT